jgi:hypothetical protein
MMGVLCLAIVLAGRITWSEDKPADGALRVVLKAVKVAATKANGQAWDVNDGRPDIVVSMKNASDRTQKEIVTDEKTDVVEATYDAGMVLVSAGQKLTIKVEDKDLAANDLIGETTYEVNADTLKKGKVTLNFGKVTDLTIEFRKP